ncbi:MAG: cyclase family protein [Bacteroidota bacterium]
MIIQFEHKQKQYQADLSKPLDVSIPLFSGANNPNAFHINQPLFEPVRVGSFIGSVQEGGACNCENLHLNAHGNGTHTECVGHISKERVTINQTLKHFFAIAQVISVTPQQVSNGDYIVTRSSIEAQLNPLAEALIIRTLPNLDNKKQTTYSGNNPTYLEVSLGELLAQQNIKHLLVDLPSVDREEDEGALATHHAFWQYPFNTRTEATITELVYVDNTIVDDIYLLNIQIASFESDASPSKPILYKLI